MNRSDPSGQYDPYDHMTPEEKRRYLQQEKQAIEQEKKDIQRRKQDELRLEAWFKSESKKRGIDEKVIRQIYYAQLRANILQEEGIWPQGVDDTIAPPPSFAVSLIPIYGSGKQAVYEFQTGHPVYGIIYSLWAASDIFLVRSIATSTGKLGIKVAGKAAAKEGETVLVHVTNAAAKEGVESTGKLGGKWGIFALKEGQVPASKMGRFLKTWQLGDLSREVRLPPGATKFFKAPPPVGIFSATRRAAGVMHAPLGYFNIRTGEFFVNKIMIKEGSEITFRQATKEEIRNALIHQKVLDYGYDSGIYVIRLELHYLHKNKQG